MLQNRFQLPRIVIPSSPRFVLHSALIPVGIWIQIGSQAIQITAEQYQKSKINLQNILQRISDTIQTWIWAVKCVQNNTDQLVKDYERTRIVMGTLGTANANSKFFHFLWSHFEADYWYYPESRFHFISSIGVIKSRISLVYDSN